MLPPPSILQPPRKFAAMLPSAYSITVAVTVAAVVAYAAMH